MPKHRETRRLPWSAAEMFDLVADIGRYPEFLPWVQGIRVGPEQDGVLVADLIVGFRMIREKFTSRVTLQRHHRIHIDYLDGPMKHLFNDWVFTATETGGCAIDFAVDFEFRNRAFEALAGMFFTQAFEKMVAAFVAPIPGRSCRPVVSAVLMFTAQAPAAGAATGVAALAEALDGAAAADPTGAVVDVAGAVADVAGAVAVVPATVTMSRIVASVEGPIPETLSRSSTDLKAPCSVR